MVLDNRLMRDQRQVRGWMFAGVVVAGAILALQFTPTFCWQNPAICARIARYRAIQTWFTPAATQLDISTEKTNDDLPFYGMQYVPEDDLERVADLGINVVLQDFPLNGSPEDWLQILDSAQAQNLDVVAWQWPPGWERKEGSNEWAVSSQARLFVETVSDHPALFAVYGTHEAYWNGCFGCQTTTRQLQTLYSQIKDIADVPIYSAFESYSFWREYSEQTTFADGICDYCDTWYYPVLDSGYDRDKYVQTLATELATFRELAPNSKFVWVLQSFEAAEYNRVMPSAEQMNEMASIALAADVDGVWWYVWTFSDSYQDFLVNHPELHPTILNVYDEFLREAYEAAQIKWYIPFIGSPVIITE